MTDAGVDNSGVVTDVISVEQIRLNAIVGIHPQERRHLQALQLDLSIGLEGQKAAYSGAIGDTLDYAMLSGIARLVLQAGCFRLLESAVEAVIQSVFAASWPLPELDAAPAPPKWVRASLTKPQALGGLGLASYKAQRQQAHPPVVTEYPTHVAESWFAAGTAKVLRCRLRPHASLASQDPSLAQALLLPIMPGLCDAFGNPIPPGRGLFLPEVGAVQNPTAQPLTVWAVTADGGVACGEVQAAWRGGGQSFVKFPDL